MKRWNKLDLDFDIVYLCGYNIWGTTRFADRDFVHALYDPAYAEKIVGAAINTGLSPDDTLECLLAHEAIEKVLLDADNVINSYDAAHEYATAGEHERVREKGGTPVRYERGLERIIKFCQKKPLARVPHDYSCAPLLDAPAQESNRGVQQLRKLGSPEAFPASKASADYGLSKSGDQCAGCTHWLGGHEADLSPCAEIDGLVRNDRWCKLFEPAAAQYSGRKFAPMADGKSDEPQGTALPLRAASTQH